MKYLFLLLSFFAGITVSAQSIKSFDYCYSKNKGIYVYSIADKKEYPVQLPNATDPCISPDGTKLAYTINTIKGDRLVGIYDLNTKQKTTLSTNNRNSYGPVWSPNGQYIAYSSFINNNWFIVVTDLKTNTTVNITKSLNNTLGSFSPTWSADSKKIVVHNMETVFIMNGSGSTLNRYKIDGFTDATSISSSNKFLLTADESRLVFDRSVDEGGSDEPPGAIYVHDLNGKTALRITPKNYNCVQPILNGGRIFFTGYKLKEKGGTVYSMDIDGKNLRTEFKNIWDFTAKSN